MKLHYSPTLLLLIVFIAQSNNVCAQITGKSSNSQNPGKEVKSETITSGSLSNDVNVFTGTLNTSYNLGTVKTLSGLSFSANLSYSSSFSSGDNMPHLSGVPFGEGWSLDVPMVSISTEDYNKYTPQEQANMAANNSANPGANLNEKTPTFIDYQNGNNCDDALEEGRIYWFAPTVNIPGVGGGRMVYKAKEGNEYVFVPNRFERYMEARLDLTTLKWKVITDDGTIYTFKYLTIQHKNPTNQRIQYDCQTPTILKNIVLPKSEITTWYCETITHPNHVDQINFQYDTYGKFDFMKVFKKWENRINTGYFNLGSSNLNMLEVPAKDIIIKKISSSTEELVLNYSTIATTGGVNLPDGTFTTVDDMYSSKIVYSTAGAGNSFANWRRYNHIRSDEISLSCDRNTHFPFESNLNPYLTQNSSQINIPNNNGLYAYKSLSGTNPITFNHGFLESPALNSTNYNLIPGDVYEVKFSIGGNYNTLFDVNIGIGDRSVTITNTEPTLNANFLQRYDCWNKRSGESVFSTFNQAIKWEPYGSSPASNTISNFFNMPNFPNTHDGINLRIGPANSDTDYSKGSLAPPQDLTLFGTSPTPIACKSFLQDIVTNSATEQSYDNQNPSPTIIRSGGSILNNFGIGQPWFMLKRRSSSMVSGTSFYGGLYECENNNDNFWWNDKKTEAGAALSSCTPNVSWGNKPTAATSGSAALNYADLIRYAKKPYMLTSVEYRVKNSSGTFVTVKRIALDYTINQLVNYAAATYRHSGGNSELTFNTNKNRNQVLLKSITQKAADNTALSVSQTPIISFTYTLFDPVSVPLNSGGSTAWKKGAYPLNGNTYILQKVVDPLGKTTELEYYPLPKQTDPNFLSLNAKVDSLSYMAVNYNYLPRPSELKANPYTVDCSCVYPTGHPSNTSSTLSTGGDVQLGRTYAYQTYLVVKTKSEYDRDGQVRRWRYNFDSIVYNYNVDRPAFSAQFVYDFSNNTIKAGFRKATVTGPYYGTTVGGPFTTYRHHVSNLYWGKPFEIESKTSSSGSVVTRQRLLYQNILAFDKPWNIQNPVQHPDFSPLTNPQTFDMPYFYETRYATEIHNANNAYLRSYFVKLVSDSITTFDNGGNYTTVTQYTYFDADYNKVTNSEGYRILLGGTLPITLQNEPSWQLFRTKTFSTEYMGANELYTQSENYYTFDLANNSTYAPGGVVNAAFKNLKFVQAKKIRNLSFETRTTNKLSFTDGAKRSSQNTIYQKFFETGGDPLTGRILPTANWIQIDTLAAEAVMSFEIANNYRAKVTWPYLLTDSISTYNSSNLAPQVLIDALGLVTTLTYNSTTGLITQQEIGTGLTDKLTTTFSYDTDNTLTTASYPNNLSYTYTYDKLKRPISQSRNGQTLSTNSYSQFNNVNASHTFQQRTVLNFISTTTYLNSTDFVVSNVYADPLGRTVGSVQDGALASNTHFDIFDRPLYTRRPLVASLPSTVLPVSGIAADYLQNTYDVAPRTRPLKSAKYGQDVTSGTAKIVNYDYAIITSTTFASLLSSAGLSVTTPTGTKFIKETITDEDGKSVLTVSNVFGQKLAEITGSGQAATAYYYNASGQVIKVINPKGQSLKYYYNYPGWLYRKNTPDEATVYYSYNKAAQVIADMNGISQVRVYQYDIYRRKLQQRYTGTSGNTMVLASKGLMWLSSTATGTYNTLITSTSSSYKTEKRWYYNTYDSGSNTLFETATQTLLSGGGQTNALGRLAQVVSYNLNAVPTNIQLLSYDNDGFVKWEVQQFNESGITVDGKGITTKIDYLEYNRAGSLIKENVDLLYDNVLDLQYYRAYDKRNRLKDVYVSYTDAGTSGRKIADYTYDAATNLLTKKRFYDRLPDSTCVRVVDSIEYFYDSRYRLTRMNSRTLDYNLTYDANQPTNSSGNQTTTNYNGNINGIYADYKSLFTGITNFTGGTVYTYTYDALNRLTLADAKVARTTAIGSLTANQLLYGNNTFSYDKIGNIDNTSIWLMDSGGSTVEEYGYKYNYAANKNVLTTIDKIAGSGLGVDRTLSTDAAGRLTADTKKSLSTITYRPSNLVWEHSFGGTNTPKTRYLYDAGDRRIYKELIHNGTTSISKEYYLYDALGHEILIMDRMPTAPASNHTWYVHGREREARFPEGRTTSGNGGLVGGGEEMLYKSDATKTDAYELPYPNRFYLVSPKDTVEPLGYLLETEIGDHGRKYSNMQTVMLNRPEDRFIVTDSTGNNPVLMDVQEILDLRAMGRKFWLEGYSGECAKEGIGTTSFLPPQSVIDPRFYIYDHLGNTRVVYNSAVPTNCGTTTYTLEYAADYSPYGRLLRSYTASGAKERFLTTGHERDPETGYDNRGARLYDAEIGRFLTVDPLSQKYQDWSPYCYVKGNPVIYMDPDGMDNIIYIVVLAGAEKMIDIDKTINTANKYLGNIGVNTRVVQFLCDPNTISENLEIGGLDKTDAIAVLGMNGQQIREFISSELSSIVDIKDFADFKGDGGNPERSEGPGHQGPDKLANFIALSATGIVESNFTSKWDKRGVGYGAKDPKNESAAFYILHGAAHNGGLLGGAHSNSEGFTGEGNIVRNEIMYGRGYRGQLSGNLDRDDLSTRKYRTDIKHFRDYFRKSLNHSHNRAFIESHFGKNTPSQGM